MRIWLVTVGEPLPLEGNRDRLWRTGLLAEILAGRGHEVLWWTSVVDHFRKTRVVPDERRVRLTDRLAIQFLNGRLYRRNVSVARVLNHRDMAHRFEVLSPDADRPDVIVCSFPTIELSREAVRYARQRQIPVILDIRDLWPDIFLDLLPSIVRPIGKLALRSEFRDTCFALSNADALFAVSEGYLDWGLAKAGRSRGANDAVLPLGYQMADSSATDERNLQSRLEQNGVRPERLFATFVGTFGQTYDLTTVIDAGRLLVERGCETVQLLLCGSGDREREWRAAAKEIPNVIFPGWLPGGELSCLLRRSSIGLAAYRSGAPQGLPNKVIEYLAAGLPVLSSLAGESRELLEAEGCGTYYPAGDSAALASSLQNLVADQLRRENMRKRATELFERRFSASHVYGEMADKIERISGRHFAATSVAE